nr:unnamed protein product [Callosobruchus chinensis]
MVQLVRTSSTS